MVLLNPLELDFTEPYEVIPDYFFRRPTAFEVNHVRASYAKLLPTFGGGPSVPYEYEWIKRPDGHPVGGHTSKPLPPERWRYSVISYPNGNVDFSTLELALWLLSPSLEVGMNMQFASPVSGPGLMYHYPPLLSYASAGHRHVESIHTLTTAELSKTKRYYLGITAAQGKRSVLMKNFQSLRDLRGLPRESDAMVILSFAILESLVTHKPRLIDSLDSIKHQVRSKLVLLNRRFDHMVAVGRYFDALPEDKIWSLLYDFRSCIAHGQDPDMNRTFKALHSRQVICDFLEEVVKSLLAFGLVEPQFLEDLRAV
jgi:hypothetical protein